MCLFIGTVSQVSNVAHGPFVIDRHLRHKLRKWLKKGIIQRQDHAMENCTKVNVCKFNNVQLMHIYVAIDMELK